VPNKDLLDISRPNHPSVFYDRRTFALKRIKKNQNLLKSIQNYFENRKARFTTCGILEQRKRNIEKQKQIKKRKVKNAVSVFFGMLTFVLKSNKNQ
jgi:hypothetical protein